MSTDDDLLQRGIAALRDEVDVDPMQALATRSRVLRSLDHASRRRRRFVGAATMAAILSTGTLSWAWATGRIEPVMASVGMTRSAEIAPVVEAAKARRKALARPTAEIDVGTETIPGNAPSETAPSEAGPSEAAPSEAAPSEAAPKTVTGPGSEPVEATVPATRPAPRAHGVASPAAAAAPETDVDRALYRRAHELHFRDNSSHPAAALAAWDAYLAARPAGRLAVEARYNRALTLVRLGRRAEAAAALQPFARGEVSPTGYRQREARALIAAIADAPAQPDAPSDDAPALGPETAPAGTR